MRSASSRQPARALPLNRVQPLIVVASPEPNLPTSLPVSPANNHAPRISERPLALGSPGLLIEARRRSPSKEHDARAPVPVSLLGQTSAGACRSFPGARVLCISALPVRAVRQRHNATPTVASREPFGKHVKRLTVPVRNACDKRHTCHVFVLAVGDEWHSLHDHEVSWVRRPPLASATGA